MNQEHYLLVEMLYQDLMNNQYEVHVEFYIQNAPAELVDLSFTLEITIMATTEKRLNVTDLDFDDIKGNLKTFMSNQSEFTDYDFEGSGINALLDVLAYNTHYLAMNMNMVANESFLDTASVRSSVVSHAKTLGYIPNSAKVSYRICKCYIK